MGIIPNYEQLILCISSRVLAKLGASLCKTIINPVAAGSNPFVFFSLYFGLFIIFVVVVEHMGETKSCVSL